MDDEQFLNRWRRRADEIDREASAIVDPAMKAKLYDLADTLRQIADEAEMLLPQAATGFLDASPTRH